MEIIWRLISWEREEENGRKGTGNKKHNWKVQNRQEEVKNSMGNGKAKELICTTHGHELRWVNAVRGLIILLIFILVKSLGFLKIYFIDYAITVVTFFSPLYFPPPTSHHHSPQLSSCPWVGHTYKFFGFSISHTILNLPLSIL